MRTFFGRVALGLLSTALAACTAHGDRDAAQQKPGRAAQALTNASLPAGTSISIDITSAAIVEPGTVDVQGTASIGTGLPLPNTSLVYVLDVSGSTGAAGGCGGDQNGDGSSNTILDCEIAATRALNQQAIADGTIGEVGVAAFGTTGATGDVGPGPAVQLITGASTDESGNGKPDVEDVLLSARIGQLQSFTLVNASSGSTSYGAGLNAAAGVLAATTKPNKVVVFLSDGLSNAAPSVATALTTFPTGVTVHTFAIGSSASCTGAATQGTLQNIADARGGTCTNVPNVASLPDVVPNVVASKLTSITLTLDGAPVPNPTTAAALPKNGPATVGFTSTLTDLTPGTHSICATAHGTDAGGSGSVTECTTVVVNAPPVAKCKDVSVVADATCSGTASIDDGSFDPDGDAITCTQVPTGATGVGTTTATLTCTDPLGATSTCTASITIVDGAPPTVTTTATPITLWPPDHTYRAFSLSSCITSITDACSGSLDVATAARIVAIESDEDESANGSGNTCLDAVITSPTTANLRAERVGSANGRVYTVHFEVGDAAGLKTTGTCTVQVPKSQSPSDATAVRDACAYCVGTGCAACRGPAATCN